MKKKTTTKTKTISPSLKAELARNNSLLDTWSLVHFMTGVLLGWIMSPLVAIVIMILWEPLEILVLSPFLDRYNIVFGFETFKNSLSDIFVDILGVAVGYYLLTALAGPPLHFF